MPDRYRVESDGVRVTVLDRDARPRRGGFRVRGEGSFLVEAPAGATVRMIVRRAGGRGSEVVRPRDGGRVSRSAARRCSRSRVPAEDAHVTFALEGR